MFPQAAADLSIFLKEKNWGSLGGDVNEKEDTVLCYLFNSNYKEMMTENEEKK